MPKPNRPRIATLENAFLIETTDDGSRTLVRCDGDLAFHSGCGAAAECDHVYLQNGGFDDSQTHWPQSVLEVGLGTGLAMIRTIDRVVAAHRPLHYVALETTAVPVETLRQLHLQSGLAAPSLSDRFLDRWDSITRELTKSRSNNAPCSFLWQVDSMRRVEFIFTDARRWLPNATAVFDTVYFDPFDPQANPDLWTEEVLRNVARLMRRGGRLVTYCVKGEIRRRMAAAGLEVRRVPGPVGGKRQVLIAIK